MSWNKGVEILAGKGRRACIDFIKSTSKLHDFQKSCFFKVFDSQVQPVLLYSAEVWGLKRIDCIERIHMLACKRFLKVPLKVPNKLIYGELGRYPLFISSAVKGIKYWLKLLHMDRSRLPHQAYLMLMNLDDRGKNCWVTSVRTTLLKLGFGYAWYNQGVGCESSFVSVT